MDTLEDLGEQGSLILCIKLVNCLRLKLVNGQDIWLYLEDLTLQSILEMLRPEMFGVEAKDFDKIRNRVQFNHYDMDVTHVKGLLKDTVNEGDQLVICLYPGNYDID